ncbi:penicillin acylase family protein [Novosphingobium sp. G106]|uniref:penicillin acylase family protein n=1 Tax=Novosphingobium sp. G106 TaxID=2849500 RepID=UPI001C2D969E|nr:penicillin acylase family protein [Novosphingobium sp. G106]MBV1688484.1 penicillin acylase family protein [Novosphingobium sp. G106]
MTRERTWFVAILALLAPAPAAAAAGGGEILWDSFGVPHVYAKTEAGMFYGFGYAQAQAHGNLLLRIYGESRARAAEYWGPQYEASDRWLIANGQPERAVVWYKAQTPRFRADLDAFAAGIDAYVAAHRDKLDPEALKVGTITGLDVMAHAHRVMTYLYIASQSRVIGAAGNVGEGEPDPASAPNENDGSNAWAVAPARSASGHAMLLANPHLQWAPSWQTYFEANLTAPGLSIYGATQVGLPVLRFAFTKDVAFTNTVNTILGFTSYKLTPSGDGYLFDGKRRPFRIEHKSYKVLQSDGGLKTVEFDQKFAVQGPVFDLPNGGGMIALKIAGLDRPGGLAQYWDMGRAHGWADMEKALRRVQVPMFNMIYADKDGHILYLDNGILPKHLQGGDFTAWSKPVTGDTSATLWNDIHGYDDLPKVFDPASGFVQNTNDPPWVTSWPQPLDPKDYPAYVSVVGPMSQRSQMSVKLMSEGPKFDFEQFIAKKVTTRSLMADRLLPELVPLAEQSVDPELRAAAALLKAWDHCFEPDAKGALLFETWAAIFSPKNFTVQANYRDAWSASAPIATPTGLKDPQGALIMLKQAIARTKDLYGAVDRPYGDVSRFRLAGTSLPANGGFGNTGVFRTITWGPMKDGQRTPVHGETWVSMIEFGSPMKAVGLMSYGNSSQPGSRHSGDQLPFLANKTFRTLWIDRAEVEKHVEEVTRF